MILKIERIGSDGEGIAYLDGKPVFIYYAYLDEVVEVDVFENKRGALEGNLLKVIEKSPHRRDSIYEDNRLNTAMNLSHINYFEQLKFKRRTLQFLVNQKLRKENIKVLNTVEAKEEFYYRNKVELPIRTINGKNKAGLFVRGSRNFLPIDGYITHQPILDHVLNDVLNLLNKHKLEGYSPKSKKGLVSHLQLRTNLENEVQVTIVLARDYDLKPLVKDLSKISEIVSVYKLISDLDEYNAMSGRLVHLSGKGHLKMKIGNLDFLLTPKAFFQLNTNQAHRLYERIVELGNFKKSDIVLDAYSGVGTIASFIAPHVKEVVAIESIKDSVRAMNESLVINNINNVKTVTGDVLKVVNYLKLKFDCMVFDPPRTGLGEKLVKFILKQRPKKIIYTSCDPKTLTKDLEQLTTSYTIDHIEPFDMFPNTSQIESITILNLKGENKL